MDEIKQRTKAILDSSGRTGNALRLKRGESIADAMQRAVADARASLPDGVVFELRGRLPGQMPVAAWIADMAEQGDVTGLLPEPIEYPNRGIAVYGRMAA